MSDQERVSQINALAGAQGFPLCGLAAVPKDGTAPRALGLEDWLAQGREGVLSYMRQTAETRKNIHLRFPWARSFRCLGLFYDASEQGERGTDLIAHVARYARGRDYHLIFEKRLKALGSALIAERL